MSLRSAIVNDASATFRRSSDRLAGGNAATTFADG
jgi:hypothetical protein